MDYFKLAEVLGFCLKEYTVTHKEITEEIARGGRGVLYFKEKLRAKSMDLGLCNFVANSYSAGGGYISAFNTFFYRHEISKQFPRYNYNSIANFPRDCTTNAGILDSLSKRILYLRYCLDVLNQVESKLINDILNEIDNL